MERPISFEVTDDLIGLEVNLGILSFVVNGVSPEAEDNLRLLEDGFFRLLEDGSFRLLE